MSDPRERGRDAVALVTALIPVYTAESDAESEEQWEKITPVVVDMLKDKSRGDLVTLCAHIAHMMAAASVGADPEDPYAKIREYARYHV